jgi:hypothetical protein
MSHTHPCLNTRYLCISVHIYLFRGKTTLARNRRAACLRLKFLPLSTVFLFTRLRLFIHQTQTWSCDSISVSTLSDSSDWHLLIAFLLHTCIDTHQGSGAPCTFDRRTAWQPPSRILHAYMHVSYTRIFTHQGSGAPCTRDR